MCNNFDFSHNRPVKKTLFARICRFFYELLGGTDMIDSPPMYNERPYDEWFERINEKNKQARNNSNSENMPKL